MIDIKTRKALYKYYSKCKWMEVSKECQERSYSSSEEMV